MTLHFFLLTAALIATYGYEISGGDFAAALLMQRQMAMHSKGILGLLAAAIIRWILKRHSGVSYWCCF